MVSETRASHYAVSLVCPLLCWTIHHTQPAQSNMTKCNIILIRDLQLFCDVTTNTAVVCYAKWNLTTVNQDKYLKAEYTQKEIR